VRIRPAEGDDDLLACARIFAPAAADLFQRYIPQQTGDLPFEPEERLPMYRHLAATGVVYVAEDPAPVGFSAAIVRRGVWFLSQLWVLPERQGKGIGSALLDEALAWGKGSTVYTVISSPHPGAQLLYLRASMYPLWAQHGLLGGRAEKELPQGIDRLTGEDVAWVDALDEEVRGAARPEDHGFFRAEATGLALRRDGEPRGYVYVGPDGRVGPGAVWDPADVPVLLRAARHVAGGPMTVSVPASNWSALRELVGNGLTLSGTSTFMASRPLGDASRYLSSGGALC
jgi:GNAT superfamily N-acetyltransferase